MRDLQAARGTAITETQAIAVRQIPARSARLLTASLALVLLGLDQFTKWLALTLLDPARPVSLLGGLVTLRLVRNPGAAFSFGERYTWVFTTLAAVALVAIIGFFLPRVRHRAWAVIFGLMLPGIAGNFIDRVFREPAIFRGHVVDFVQLPNFAIFNFADVCIDTAAVLIFWFGIWRRIGLDGNPTRS